jgi:hypothetical protein
LPAPPAIAALLAIIALAVGSAAPAQVPDRGGLTAEIADAFAAAAATRTDDLGGSAGIACQGDCNDNGVVSVDEIIRGVVIATGALEVGNCPAFDANGDGRVSINELIGAIAKALEGCTGTGPVSVCGGPITSAPKLCDLRVEPARVEAGRTITISFGMSDLEGDITTVCIGLGRVGGTGMEQCGPIDPVGQTINVVAELPGIAVNLAPGDYEMAVAVVDATETPSNIVTTRFTVIRIRR